MASVLGRRTPARLSLAPAALAVLLGLLAHAADQLLFTRAGPIPILATAPVVATLLYLHDEAATYRRVLLLLAWGIVGSGAAVVGVYLGVVNYALPRSMTGAEMVAYDLGMFLWFVLALAGTYVLARRTTGSDYRTTAVLLAGPLLQVAWLLPLRLLVATGLYA